MENSTKNMQNRTYLLPESIYCPVKLPADFPILLARTDHWYMENQDIQMYHFHNCIQIGYCYEGSGHTIVEGRLSPFESGNVTVLPAKAQHLVVTNQALISRWVWLYLDPFNLLPDMHPVHSRHLMQMLLGQEEMPFTLQQDSEEMLHMIHGIIKEMENRETGYQDVVRLQMHAFLLMLLRKASQLPEASVKKAQTQMQIIAPAVEHIALHYMDHVTVEEMASMCHISCTHLRRVFTRVMKCSPLEYLQQVRLEAACVLLFRSDLPVPEIGSRVGFPTTTSFNRQFKKLMKTTPNQWRRRGRSEGK